MKPKPKNGIEPSDRERQELKRKVRKDILIKWLTELMS
jgi:hypothetical protein